MGTTARSPARKQHLGLPRGAAGARDRRMMLRFVISALFLWHFLVVGAPPLLSPFVLLIVFVAGAGMRGYSTQSDNVHGTKMLIRELPELTSVNRLSSTTETSSPVSGSCKHASAVACVRGGGELLRLYTLKSTCKDVPRTLACARNVSHGRYSTPMY